MSCNLVVSKTNQFSTATPKSKVPIKQQEAFLWRRRAVLALRESLGLNLLPGTHGAQAGSAEQEGVFRLATFSGSLLWLGGTRGCPVALPGVGELLRDSLQKV